MAFFDAPSAEEDITCHYLSWVIPNPLTINFDLQKAVKAFSMSNMVAWHLGYLALNGVSLIPLKLVL